MKVTGRMNQSLGIGTDESGFSSWSQDANSWGHDISIIQWRNNVGGFSTAVMR
jgi:hypothetical protein